MKYIYKSIAVLLFSISVNMPAFAADKPMKMDMGMSEEMKDKHARNYQQYILKIDELSDQIRAEENGQKKEVLMTEQLQLIKGHQEKMRQMKKKMMKKHHQMMMKKMKDKNM